MARHAQHSVRQDSFGELYGTPRQAAAAYRWAWLSLLLFPVSLVAAFAVGEGLFTSLGSGGANTAQPLWVVLCSSVPAFVVFALPAVLAYGLGHRAVRLGRRSGMTPAIVAVAISIAFVLQNVLAYVAQLAFGPSG